VFRRNFSLVRLRLVRLFARPLLHLSLAHFCLLLCLSLSFSLIKLSRLLINFAHSRLPITAICALLSLSLSPLFRFTPSRSAVTTQLSALCPLCCPRSLTACSTCLRFAIVFLNLYFVFELGATFHITFRFCFNSCLFINLFDINYSESVSLSTVTRGSPCLPSPFRLHPLLFPATFRSLSSIG
jgi:hypothetical protein